MTKPNPQAKWRTEIWQYSPRIDLLSEVEKVWIACAIDTEGTIGLFLSKGHAGNRKVHIHIAVANTNLEFLQRFQILLNTGLIYKASQGLGVKPCWVYRLHNFGDCLQLMKSILPYLIMKKERANLAIGFLESRRNEGSYYYTDSQVDFVNRMQLLMADERVGKRKLMY